jgi:hypothetical protein
VVRKFLIHVLQDDQGNCRRTLTIQLDAFRMQNLGMPSQMRLRRVSAFRHFV